MLGYRECEDLVTATAFHLQETLADQGSRVALYAENSRAMIVAIASILRAGAVACPLSPRLPHSAITGALGKLRTDVLVSDSTALPVPSVPLSSLLPGTSRLRESRPGSQSSGNTPAILLFTSGSTDEPKIAVLTHDNLYYNALGANENIPVGEGDRWLLSLPLYHVGGIGIVMRTMLGGGAVVIPDSRLDLARQALHFGATHLSLVTTQLQRLLAQPDLCSELRAQLKVILLGGSSFPITLVKRALDAGLPIVRSYGLTEAASQVTTTSPDDPPGRLRSSGRVLPYRELHIDKNREILVRGKTVFAGYWRDGQVEADCDAEGWFATGDLGTVDADGYLTVLGRRDNMFISGGENIQPEEIEQMLLQVADVLEALVVPVRNDRFGQRPVAFVRMADNAAPDSDSLTGHLRHSLPAFKVPDHFYAWPPDTPADKMKPSRTFFKQLAADQS